MYPPDSSQGNYPGTYMQGSQDESDNQDNSFAGATNGNEESDAVDQGLSDGSDSNQVDPTSSSQDELAPEEAPIDDPNAPTEDPTQTEDTTGADQGNEELENLLKALTDKYDLMEQPVRESRAKKLKLIDLYWQGLTNVYWDGVQTGYFPINSASMAGLSTQTEYTDDDLPKTVNNFKAFGESIIAALSNGIPKVKFFPNDADSYDDVTTAKVKSVVVRRIERDNVAELLMMKMLFIICNQGPVFGNICTESNGKVTESVTDTVPDPQDNYVCPQCGQPMQPSMDPSQPSVCQACGYVGEPHNQQTNDVKEIQREVTKEKHKINIELYGALNCFVPAWVTCQKKTPYVGKDYETDVAWAQDRFPGIADAIFGTNASDTYLRWARLTSEYIDQSTTYLVTIRERWYRPWAFLNLGLEDGAVLKAAFPKGVHVTYVDDQIAEYKEVDLDEEWEISENPIYNDIFGQPLMAGMLDVQDMSDELLNLTRDTIAQGVGLTFVDPTVLDATEFGKSRARPGQLYFTKPSLGKSISDGFHETKTAVLSDEVNAFRQSLQEMGQFTSGAYPSIYGGAVKGSGGTLGEYESSRNQALQRLNINWKVIGNFWASLMGKAADMFIDAMEVDAENLVTSQGDTYINNWIKKSELSGQIGRVEAQYSDQFPISWSEKRDILQNLLTLNNEGINAILARPENAELVSSLLGLVDIFIPGADDRNKQLWEIGELIKTADQFQPPAPPMPGQLPPMQPQQSQSTVPIEPEVDNNDVHVEICKEYLNSDRGITLKQVNPPAYANIVAHLSEHLMQQQMEQMQQMQMEAQSNAGSATSQGSSNSGSSGGNNG